LLVEGASDAAAVGVLARRVGLDLGASGGLVIVLGGATNVGAAARALGAVDHGVRLLALCDVGEERHVRVALDGLPGASWFVCEADLEDEMIRALGPLAVEQLLEQHDELESFRRFQRQPAQRGRDHAAQLRRFIGTRSGRKHRYGSILAEALASERIPRPLADLLGAMQPP
jgi:hypothetical protein